MACFPETGRWCRPLIAATGCTPRVAGKPDRPLLDAAVRRSAAKSPLVVGDRLDTDIELAVLAGMPSLLVLTGVSTAADLLAAPESRRPTYVSFDLRGLVEERKVLEIIAGRPSRSARQWSVDVDDHTLVLRKADDTAVADLEYERTRCAGRAVRHGLVDRTDDGARRRRIRGCRAGKTGAAHRCIVIGCRRTGLAWTTAATNPADSWVPDPKLVGQATDITTDMPQEDQWIRAPEASEQPLFQESLNRPVPSR